MSYPSAPLAWGRRRDSSVDSRASSSHSNHNSNHNSNSNSSRKGRQRAASWSRASIRPSLQLEQQLFGGEAKLSSSMASPGHREPIRSFINPALRDNLAPVNSAEYARSVREDTAELATYQLADRAGRRSPSFLSRNRSLSLHTTHESIFSNLEAADNAAASDAVRTSDPLIETSEPEPSPSPEEEPEAAQKGTHQYDSQDTDSDVEEGPSLLARALRRSPPDSSSLLSQKQQRQQRQSRESAPAGSSGDSALFSEDEDEAPSSQPREAQPTISVSAPKADPAGLPTESTPLLGDARVANGHVLDLEGQKNPARRRLFGLARWPVCSRVIAGMKGWDRQYLWKNIVVAPVVCLPAVIVGLLLNILDALSYGMILFPLGSPIFAHLGSAGISIFYVSTIISQVVFSCGSIFTGGVGSELIEVVPFFHSMAYTITDIVGESDHEAVIATTITSYAISAMLTGTVFFLMGYFRFGYIVGFIPRHILIGCIGGVGWFLVVTGFEVTARIDGNLEYDLNTLHQLLRPGTVPLWATPLALATALFWSQKHISSKYFLPLYILAIPFLFYLFALFGGPLDPSSLRSHGWVFEGPPAGEPWWFFYTLYQFDKVHWNAILQCLPAMCALTFFGILHVPINVPALALNIGEDHADLNHELKLHGLSNLISGASGSIQNYLVYANTLFFMRSGGDSRLAGFELAILTFCVMLVGPKIIGFIPIMMVGCLIFDLGFELLVEAVWLPRKKLKLPEYVTVIVIVLIMGIYDFVVGIGVGILLAFVSLIFQTSQVSAVRTRYTGESVSSTVRRNPSQQHYLRQVGRQICIIKLAGFLFFGTIVSVEETIRNLIAEDSFRQRPVRYLILDLRQVTGLDYSAGEAFNTISRLLNSKGIHLVLSSVDPERAIGHDLRAVGLGEDGIDVAFLPDINSALELCENELLKSLYVSQAAMAEEELRSKALSVPRNTPLVSPGETSLAEDDDGEEEAAAHTPHRQMLNNAGSSMPSLDLLASSPRRSQLQKAARELVSQMQGQQRPKWQNFSEPLRLMLQIFHDVSDRNEDFWFRATRYFARKEYRAGDLLFRAGESAGGFYLLEKGIVRADYALANGQRYHENIVAGTTCGELPFFSNTPRTATAYADMDCVVWRLDRANWERLQQEEPEVARELLLVSLKLTAERMETVPSSTMLMAD